MNRRDFLRVGAAGGTLALGPVASALASVRQSRTVAVVADPADPVVAAVPVQRALAELQRTLEGAGVAVVRLERIDQVTTADRCVVVAGAASSVATLGLAASGIAAPAGAERLAVAPVTLSGRPVLLAAGGDVRGLMYAVRDLADRVRFQPVAPALDVPAPVVQRPANPVRSVMRQFTSETLDSPWFFDREMWPAYLAMLAGHRFNRLHLGFGLGYDTLRRVTDSYLLFIYPFLVDVPGYDVRMSNLADAERSRILDTLRFISEEAVAHGLDFELGIWTHGFDLIDSPDARYHVQGLTPETHAPYCRDALAAVLRACPAISSVALRIHGESGIAEGSYQFWRTVFDGVPRSGRTVEIDLHAKGIDQAMIDTALGTGMPVAISPKYWAEHLGMPYHQAAIRDLEMPVEGRVGRGLMTLSEGARVFTRYGYADLLRDDRRFAVRHRVFSGTQRLLASGDPRTAAAYGRMFRFCGSTGVDLMEPLTCRGRRGTGAGGGRRTGYIDASLEPRRDWEKFADWYRTWGRLAYDPDTSPDVWERPLGTSRSAMAMRSAVSRASRILPIVTTAHLPSAACDAYWPEVYWNQPIAVVPRPNPYGDTPTPRTFQHVSPLDPELFSTMTAHAGELLAGTPDGKYSPIEVAEWLETLAAGVIADLERAGPALTIETRRLVIDAAIQADLGRFFAAKFRAGVLYAIHEQRGDRRALAEAVAAYRRARDAWAAIASRAEGVYADDLSASDKISNRGQWADRLPAIDADIDALAAGIGTATTSTDPRVSTAIEAALGHPDRGAAPCTHAPPGGFRPGRALAIEIAADVPLAWARLHYRHVNQAERYVEIAMRAEASRYRAEVPAGYTGSPWPLQYYVSVGDAAGRAWIVPGFDETLDNQPYVVLQRL